MRTKTEFTRTRRQLLLTLGGERADQKAVELECGALEYAMSEVLDVLGKLLRLNEELGRPS